MVDTKEMDLSFSFHRLKIYWLKILTEFEKPFPPPSRFLKHGCFCSFLILKISFEELTEDVCEFHLLVK